MTMRIHKFLSTAGMTSRRRAEVLVHAGKVTVNGVTATIGQVIDETKDKVVVEGREVQPQASKVYYLVNKPRFYISTVSDPQGRQTVMSLVPGTTHLYPVGRLDYESEGLMILTNDGDFAFRLTHPKFQIEKTYRVQVKGKLTPTKSARLEKGVYVDGRKTAPARIENVEIDADRTWFDITIHEGRNRQVRKMCEIVDLPVTRLIRIRLGDYELGDLKPGECRQTHP